METIDDIFDLLGGPAVIGRLIGKSTEHAATMRRRGSIPVDYWPRLIDALNALGHEDKIYSADDFLAVHVKQGVAA